MSDPKRDAISEVPTSEIRLTERAASLQSSVDLVVSDVPPVSTATALLWTDRLLGCSVEATLSEGRLIAIQSALLRVADLFEPCQIAVLLEQPIPASLVHPTGPSVVIEHGADRVLTGCAEELRFEIDGDPFATLILGLPDDLMLDTSSARWLASRLAKVLAVILEKSSLIETSGGNSQKVERLEAQVVQAEKLASLGEIAAGIVHELNNPLTAIVAYSDALQKRFESNGNTSEIESMRRISEAAERILKFSRDLVAYARPSSGIRSPVNIHDVVDQALHFCEHVLSQHSIVVVREYEASAPVVQGVSGELTQIFVNLLTNACHVTPADGRIEIVTRSDESGVEIAVRDHGTGIELAHIDRVFEPFFTTKPAGNGTGLGLSIVRGIVERHQGQVTVESHGRDGTTFWVKLPRVL